MRKLILLLNFVLLATSSLAQEKKDFNFILVVDDVVWVTYTNLKIKIKDSVELPARLINCLYYPGNLSLEKGDYEKLLSAKEGSLSLIIDYEEMGKADESHHIFDIPFSASWFDNYFLVLRIYNLKNRKYRNIFEPLDKARNYTFELDYPGGQMLRVRSRVGKK